MEDYYKSRFNQDKLQKTERRLTLLAIVLTFTIYYAEFNGLTDHFIEMVATLLAN